MPLLVAHVGSADSVMSAVALLHAPPVARASSLRRTEEQSSKVDLASLLLESDCAYSTHADVLGLKLLWPP